MRIISGLLKGRPLKRPESNITRPTSDRVRESIFNILLHFDGFEFQGSVVLDVFAGSGAMGIEALSRGAERAVFIDNDRSACKVISENIQMLKLTDRSSVLCCNAFHIQKLDIKFDLIFMDPPYFQDLEIKTLTELFQQGFIKLGTIVAVEHSKNTEFEPDNKLFLLLTRRSFSNTTISIFKAFNI